MSSASFPERANAHSPYVILAALSSDESGEFALLEAARTAAARPGSDLHIVHVIREDGAAESGELVTLERRLANAPAALERQVTRLQELLPARVTAHVRAGQPARSILQTAVDVNADLIVIGTHHHSRIEAIINGSVVDRVLRDAHCPVLVAVPKNYDGAMKSETIEPPCPDCVAARRDSSGQTFWCERHSRGYNQPHVYEPNDRGRAAAVMPGH